MSPHTKSKVQTSTAVFANRARLWLFVRVICFVVAIVLLWPILPITNSLGIVPGLSPFVAITSILGTRTFNTLTWLGLAVGVVVLVRHRFFCHWICPVGLCVDGASKLGRRLERKSMRVPLLGRWIVWLTIGGALIGYPLLIWLDPLAIFTNVPFLFPPSSQFGMWLPATGFFAIVILSITWPQTWCNKICPLGAFQDLLSSARRYLYSIITRNNKSDNKMILNLPISRRTVFSITAGVAVAYVTRTVGAKNSHPLRPPGALDESQFAGVCSRCGNCLRVCPSGIIERDIGQIGLSNLFTPVLSFDNDYCREDCIRCTEVCPSGALNCLLLKEKTGIQIGLPRVDMNICLLGDDRECSECKRWCPYDAIRYVFSETQYTLVPKIDPKKCNGCGACEAICPTEPKKAIVVLPDPMH